jgi:hypothetical protein
MGIKQSGIRLKVHTNATVDAEGELKMASMPSTHKPTMLTTLVFVVVLFILYHLFLGKK